MAKGNTRRIRSNSADSVIFSSSLVDSDGIIQGLTNNNVRRDELLAASVGGLASSFIVNDKELVGKGGVCGAVLTPERSNVEGGADNVHRIDNNDECLKVCSKSWRIEDYEGTDAFDDIKPQNYSDPRKLLLQRVGSKVASSARNLLSNHQNDDHSTPKQSSIKTNEIKHILLKSQSMPIVEDEKRSTPLGYAAFRSFLQGNSRNESDDTKTSYPCNVECDSRPAIWIKSEDGADISGKYINEMCKKD